MASRLLPGAGALCLAAACLAVPARGQAPGGPRNDLPQPYRRRATGAQLPPGVKWAAVTAIEPAPDGTIYVIHRCFANSCAGRTGGADPQVQRRGASCWPAGARGCSCSRTAPRSIRDGNLWVTDARGDERQGPSGVQVQPGRQGADDARQGGRVAAPAPTCSISRPTCVVAPNGDIFVTDSHRNGKNNRIVKFTKDGRFIKEWGSKGSGPGEISEPHTIAMDSRGRLFVGDRENNRIQIFDQDGTYLDEWRQFGRPSGISITRDDTIYVADSESGPDTGARELPGIKKGIRIGSATDGSVTAFIEDMESTAADHSGAEGVGVDAQGNVYGAVVRRQMLERHVRKFSVGGSASSAFSVPTENLRRIVLVTLIGGPGNTWLLKCPGRK